MKNKGTERKVDWKTINWDTTTNKQIKDLYKVSDQRISTMRSKLAPNTLKNYNDVDWSKVDWKLSNKELSTSIGYSLTYICGKRRLFAPETIDYRQTRKADWENIDWASMSNLDVSKTFGVTYMTAFNNRSRYAKHTRAPRRLWKDKVENLITGKQSAIVADNYINQSAIRNAGYNLGCKLKSKIRSDGKVLLTVKDK